jgi:hypothetical protein
VCSSQDRVCTAWPRSGFAEDEIAGADDEEGSKARDEGDQAARFAAALSPLCQTLRIMGFKSLKFVDQAFVSVTHFHRRMPF